MRFAPFLCIAAILFCTVWLVYENRTSERIVGAAVAAVLATLGTVLAVILLSENPPVSETVVAAFPVELDGSLQMATVMSRVGPLSLPEITVNEAIVRLREQKHYLVNDSEDSFGQALYQHVLQRGLIEWMSDVFRAGWRIREESFAIPGHFSQITRTADPPKAREDTVISHEDIEGYLSKNAFRAPFRALPSDLVLPPRTDLSVTIAEGTFDPAVIAIDNPFCAIKITIRRQGGLRGLGLYPAFDAWMISRMGNVPYEPPPPYATTSKGIVHYRIGVNARFSRFRIGHPDMPLYRRWVSNLVSFMRHDWDEPTIAQRALQSVETQRMME